MLKNTVISDYLENGTVANMVIASYLLAQQTFQNSVLNGIKNEAARLFKEGVEVFDVDGEITLPVGYNQFAQVEDSIDEQMSQPAIECFLLETKVVDCGEFGTFPLVDFVMSYPEQAAELWLLLEQEF